MYPHIIYNAHAHLSPVISHDFVKTILHMSVIGARPWMTLRYMKNRPLSSTTHFFHRVLVLLEVSRKDHVLHYVLDAWIGIVEAQI